jgi:hypothetical protein
MATSFYNLPKKLKVKKLVQNVGGAPSKNTSRNVMKFFQFFWGNLAKCFSKKGNMLQKNSFLKTLHLCEILQGKKYG